MEGTAETFFLQLQVCFLWLALSDYTLITSYPPLPFLLYNHSHVCRKLLHPCAKPSGVGPAMPICWYAVSTWCMVHGALHRVRKWVTKACAFPSASSSLQWCDLLVAKNVPNTSGINQEASKQLVVMALWPGGRQPKRACSQRMISMLSLWLVLGSLPCFNSD